MAEAFFFDFVHENNEYRLEAPFDGAFRLRAMVDGAAPLGACEILARDMGEEIDATCEELTVTEEGGVTRISVEDMEAVLTLSPFSLAFFSEGEEKCRLTSLSAASFTAPLGKTPIFGTGERFNLANQRGKKIDLYSIDRWCQTEGNSYVPIPLFITTLGYHYFLNRYERMMFDLDSEETGVFSAEVLERGSLDLYVFLTDDPTEVLYNYAYLSGFSPSVPDWAYGIHVSRHGGLREFGSIEGVLEMAQKMDEFDLPWDVAILEGWEPYDYLGIEDLKKLNAYLTAKGKRYLLYQSCGRYLDYKNKHARPEELAEITTIHDEYAVSDALTGEVMLPDINIENPADAPNARIYRWLDTTHPDAREQWFDGVWAMFARDCGCAGAKMDFCEQFPGNRPLNFHDGRDISGTHHWYPVYLNAMTFRNFAEKRGEAGAMLFARGGAIGAQRYPIMWAGDQLREWRFLPAMLRGVLTAGLSGVPFMGFDLGGYLVSRDPENNPDVDIFLRGAEMACFSVCMQTHGKVRRPYDFEDEVIDVYRLYCNLHEALIPYLAEQGRAASTSGLPLMRHLFLSHPTDETVYSIDDEYFLGEALLCAPVLDGKDCRDVYLPEGDYVGLFDGKEYRGGTWLRDFPAPLSQTPVFVKKDHFSDVLGTCLAEAKEIIREIANLK
ncbi:MAG: glycoside hydrolase family 31 protein [Clostridia bacterium]|nr:glycoside hydrolase family 31 protein [Clostridia bacterium]